MAARSARGLPAMSVAGAAVPLAASSAGEVAAGRKFSSVSAGALPQLVISVPLAGALGSAADSVSVVPLIPVMVRRYWLSISTLCPMAKPVALVTTTVVVVLPLPAR